MKYALVTGCSNGSIGSALAKALAEHSFIHVFATSRSLIRMSDLSSYHNITLLELDVTSPISISAAVAAIKKTTMAINFILNYAGLGYNMPFLDSTVNDCQKVFDVNVWGLMRIVQAFAPLIVAGQGTIVIAGTTVEILGMPFQAAYCGSKAALFVMGDTLRREMKPLGVKVLHITTGLVQSNWHSNIPKVKMPDQSFYGPIKAQLEAGTQEYHAIHSMQADIYAKSITKDILRGRDGRLLRGNSSWFHWILFTWLPGWLFDWAIARETSLDMLSTKKTI